MSSVNFYELQIAPVERVLPQLVLKAHEQNLRGLVLASDKEKLEELNRAIWIFKQDAFIPHGTSVDGKPENQPFYLSLVEENLNNSSIVFVTDGRIAEGSFDKYMDVFDGTIPTDMSAAKERMELYKSRGIEVNHYRQNPKGGWEKA